MLWVAHKFFSFSTSTVSIENSSLLKSHITLTQFLITPNLMFKNVINQVRTFGYTMKNPIPRKIFFLYHFAPQRYTEFKDLMNTLHADYRQGLINEEQIDSALLAF